EGPENINDKHDTRAEGLDGASHVGVTAGASTPEFLVGEVVAALGRRQSVAVQEVHVVEEELRFGLPRELEDVAKAAGKTLPPRSGVRVSEE
ncbi:MAG: 4-hydroxy-3-methylbut-2-enyl diphosphate reductase, partial [Candidatus Rokubacteria bacterium]|nr:4-hydroxy-3-methylbut-2-enyl diphosphate reductase [Candidatus Rokubacteria bacterium]